MRQLTAVGCHPSSRRMTASDSQSVQPSRHYMVPDSASTAFRLTDSDLTLKRQFLENFAGTGRKKVLSNILFFGFQK